MRGCLGEEEWNRVRGGGATRPAVQPQAADRPASLKRERGRGVPERENRADSLPRRDAHMGHSRSRGGACPHLPPARAAQSPKPRVPRRPELMMNREAGRGRGFGAEGGPAGPLLVHAPWGRGPAQDAGGARAWQRRGGSRGPRGAGRPASALRVRGRRARRGAPAGSRPRVPSELILSSWDVPRAGRLRPQS